ncbi:protein-export membrane protein SecD [Prauserella marina]|uniref:Protein translocase subunit SecD n=1 Tax=Prauserella marina TaxID=530584 RepID=A0A222VSQ8_9PSEU|nr:protein translocase subunit SecD [Prauserella marina]ASR36944.1 protein-export membrane protein SecD [Prauserella marina]PWV80102.1 preprotein translocase subunit SecD [Prauserella marina]SDD83194.1 preprotein translocase subunit SecD [Prauserella marina]
MAPPAGQIRPGRYLTFFLLIVVVLYGLVFLTGDRKPTPKLGIDLQGGTRVTLTARTPDGQAPSRDQLQQARQIIETRVNGIGVSGAEVLLDGSNVVITVPGNEGEQAKTLGRTAKLGFRQVINAVPATAPPQQQQGDQQGQQPPPSESPGAEGSQGDENGQGGQDAQGTDGSGGGSAPGAARAPTTGDHAQQPSQDPSPPPTPGDGEGDGQTPEEKVAAEIQQAKDIRQNPALLPADPNDQAAMAMAQQAQQEALTSLVCREGSADPLVGNDDPAKPLVTCNEDGSEKYVLGPVFLEGTEISDASSGYDNQRGANVVNLQFKSGGASTWADFTAANVNQRAAFVLDTKVVSAPNITEAIPNGQTQITGQFTQDEAKNLADVLKYGSLPLSFSSSDATTVSATLGLASLEAGLIAGGIGLALVFIYCLFYYRMLGALTILSLILSAGIVYAVLVLLGRWVGFTLDLAGVAGFIIAIGVTADSFVVYFERLKDEMREGRSFRSAVGRGWVRARRTILASDAIMFLAAAVLYVLAVGEVRGFAFTLGMSTVLDLIVVFLVTHPLVALIAKSKTLSSPKLSGLGSVQKMGARRRSTARVGSATKEA